MWGVDDFTLEKRHKYKQPRMVQLSEIKSKDAEEQTPETSCQEFCGFHWWQNVALLFFPLAVELTNRPTNWENWSNLIQAMSIPSTSGH